MTDRYPILRQYVELDLLDLLNRCHEEPSGRHAYADDALRLHVEYVDLFGELYLDPEDLAMLARWALTAGAES